MDIRDYEIKELEDALEYMRLEQMKDAMWEAIMTKVKKDNPIAFSEYENVSRMLFDKLGYINQINNKRK